MFLKDKILFKLISADFTKFAMQFHREEGFFPNEPAFHPEVEVSVIHSRGERLFQDSYKAFTAFVRKQDIYRWDFLTLELAADTVNEIKQNKNLEEDLARLQAHLIVVRDYGQASRHFNFNKIDPGIRFADLLERWEFFNASEAPRGWIHEICREIRRAILSMPSESTWALLRSANSGTNWWYYPVLNHVKILPEGNMQFDIFLYPVPGPKPSR